MGQVQLTQGGGSQSVSYRAEDETDLNIQDGGGLTFRKPGLPETRITADGVLNAPGQAGGIRLPEGNSKIQIDRDTFIGVTVRNGKVVDAALVDGDSIGRATQLGDGKTGNLKHSEGFLDNRTNPNHVADFVYTPNGWVQGPPVRYHGLEVSPPPGGSFPPAPNGIPT